MEYSTLQAIDFAVGKFLVDVYENQATTVGPKNWQAFLARPTKQKIMRGDFDTPSDILKLIESNEKHATQVGAVKANPVNLPLIAYTRKPAIMVADPNAAAYQHEQRVLGPFGDGLSLSVAQLSLEYRVCMMAHDIPTLETMQLAWIFKVSKPGNNYLSYDIAIGGQKMPIMGSIIDPKTPLFEDVSLARTDGRLYAVMLSVTVRIYAVMGAEISIPDSLRWIIYPPTGLPTGPGGSNDGGLWGEGSLGGPCEGGICWPNEQ